jgi:virginiamycin A acetyltransferase
MKRSLIKVLGISWFLPRITYVLARHRVLRLVVGGHNALLDASDVMRGWRGIASVPARRAVLRSILGGAIDASTTIHGGLMSKDSICIGPGSYVGFDCNLGNVEIGANVLLSDGVCVLSGGRQHTPGDEQGWKDGEFKRIRIEDGAWIGAGAIVMASIGSGAVVGAGSVVTKPVPAGTRVAGCPARQLE